MDIRLPPGITSITFAASGPKTPVGGIVTGIQDAEGTQVVANYNRPKIGSSQASGLVQLHLPKQITSVTINGTTYPVVNGVANNVLAADATRIFNQGWINAFRPV